METTVKYVPIGGGGGWWPKEGDEGTSLIGVLTGRREEPSKLKAGTIQRILIFRKPDGTSVNVSVTAGLVRDEPLLEEGKAYSIPYEGKKKGKGPQPFKSFGQIQRLDGYDPSEFVVPF